MLGHRTKALRFRLDEIRHTGAGVATHPSTVCSLCPVPLERAWLGHMLALSVVAILKCPRDGTFRPRPPGK